MPISAREVREVVDTWGAAGARVEENGKGFRVFPPDGDRPYSMHLTISDSNAHKNMRTWGRRHGLPWPWEYNHKPNSRAPKGNPMSAADPVELPPYITEATVGASKRRIADVLGAVQRMEGRPVQVPAVNRILLDNGRGYESSSTASKVISRVLYHAGWRPSSGGGLGRTFTWSYVGGDAVLLEEVPEPTHFPDLDVHAIVTPIVPESTGGEAVEESPHRMKTINLGTGAQKVIDENGVHEIEPHAGILAINEAQKTPSAQIIRAVSGDAKGVIAALSTEVDRLTPLAAGGDDVAEQLLREAEESIEEYKATLADRDNQLAYASEQLSGWKQAAFDKDREIERLQGLLARERSGPRGADDGSWSVPITEFVQQGYPNVATIELSTLRAAKLDVLVTFRPIR